MEQTLGERITFHRKRLGMTQDNLAAQLGVTAQAVSKWENDQSCPDITMLPRLADLFDISTDELLGRPQPEVVHQAEIVDDAKEEDGKKFSFEWNAGKTQAIVLALWVLLLGVLSVVSTICQLDVGFWALAWPSFLLFLGVSGLTRRFNFFNCGCILFGAYFLVANMGIWQLDLGKELVFPIIIVLLGLFLLADALRNTSKPGLKISSHKRNKETGEKMCCEYTEDGEYFNYSLSFGDSTRTVSLPRLSGGEADCSFGDLTVDLSGCDEIADRCRISATCSFGQLTLKIPSRYRIEPTSDTTFGEIHISGKPDAQPAGTILLNADVSFGEISIEYI